MKISKKVSIITAVSLMVTGFIIFFSAFAISGFDMTELSGLKMQTNTYTFENEITDIYVEAGESDINFVRSEDSVCYVVCNESDKINHLVYMNGNTLTIKRESELEWYEYIGIFNWNKMSIDIHLPGDFYDSLEINSSSGDVTVPDNFTFRKNAEINMSSGEVNFDGCVMNNLEINVTSGDIKLTNVQAEDITLSVTSGDISCVKTRAFNRLCTEATSGDITIKDSVMDYFWNCTTSGDTDLIDSTAECEMYIESTSGDVKLDRCDADILEIITTSGDVTGTLLTEKVFDIDTESGDMDIPESSAGGKCRISTGSGDAEIEICK